MVLAWTRPNHRPAALSPCIRNRREFVVGRLIPRLHVRPALRETETERQCEVRDANEAISRLHAGLAAGLERLALRCECGDAACLACVSLTRAEYEAVRAYGSHFAVGLNHENPESACVLSEHATFGVVDVIAGDARYHALARNPRHFWAKGSDEPETAGPDIL
jgi:hypothetical protein